LTRWRAKPDLAWLRDQDALEKLPPADRQGCRTLWGDVDVPIKRTQANK